MYYHGGAVITSIKVATIYWSAGTIYSGGPAPGTTGPGSADASLVGFVLNHIGGSQLYHVATTYSNGSNTPVSDSVTYSQFWASNTNVPTSSSPPSDAAVQAEIEAGFTSGALTYDPNSLYMVFSDAGVNLGGGFVAQKGGYCAYHGHFSWNGNDVKYAAMPHVFDFHSAMYVCDELRGSPNNDFAADAEVSTAVHEIFETVTDADGNAWYDNNGPSGGEGGDKCAYYYGSTYPSNGATASTNIGGKDFLIQTLWANAFGIGVAAGGECAQGYLNVHISGPTQVEPYVVCTWTGNVDRGGTLPDEASWESTSGPFSNTWSVTQSNANMPFTIWFVVEDSKGIKGSAETNVTPNQYVPPCGP